MIKINNRTKTEGELLIRRMIDKAQAFYYGTDLIVIATNDRGDTAGILVSFDRGQTWEDVNFFELEAYFETMQEESEREFAEGGF